MVEGSGWNGDVCFVLYRAGRGYYVYSVTRRRLSIADSLWNPVGVISCEDVELARKLYDRRSVPGGVIMCAKCLCTVLSLERRYLKRVSNGECEINTYGRQSSMPIFSSNRYTLRCFALMHVLRSLMESRMCRLAWQSMMSRPGPAGPVISRTE